MPPFAFFMRCLLIVALCLGGMLSAWTSSAMAVTKAQHALTADRSVVAQGEDCKGSVSQDGRVTSHEDCECNDGAECGACAFPVATTSHAVPFAAQHGLTDHPAARSVVVAALSDNARVFRPPIG